ncbi:MAG: extracellular solute-binding protein [bacterium]
MGYSWRFRFSLLELVIFSLISLTALGCQTQDPNAGIGANVNLVVWGLWQESADMEPIIAAFQEETGVNVTYKKIASVAEYEKKLLAALAERRGPDVFVIHHTWLAGKLGLMSPAPADIIDERALREEFVDVVADDVIRDGQIYTLPTSVDTLALYYNKDILSAAGIARPPATWLDFQQVVENITRTTRFGTVAQSAAALGTAGNINRAADIMQLLLLQSGQTILDPAKGTASLADEIGERSLTFYTDFANKSKKVYTWDLQQDYSIDAFAEGATAMMLNYSYHIPTIRAKNPRLRFDIAPLPQISDGKVINFASYWPYAVSNQSPAPTAAWRFVRYLTNAESAQALNEASSTPPARRDAVVNLIRDPTLGVFAEQSLTAVTWPRIDIVAIDTIFNTMIDDVVTGAATPIESLRRAEGQLNQLQPEPESEPAAPEPEGPGLPGL